MPNDYDISKAFKRIENELLDSMMRNLKRHKVEENKEGFTWEQWQAIQLQELEEYRKKNAKLFTGDFKSIDRKVDTMFRRTAKDAQTAEEHRLMDNIKQKKFTPTVDKGGFFRLNEGKLEALITATQADFTRAEYALLRQANDQYRKIIFDAMTYANVTNDYNKAVDMATSDFLKKGYDCIQYKGWTDKNGKMHQGARHDIADYARMAIRTGNKRAYLMGEGNAHDRYGLHTVRVNKRTHACPKCVGFLGKLLIDDVYGGGTRAEATAQGIPTLSDAMRAGFLHPNCKDIYSAYIEGVSRPAKPWSQEEIGKIVGEYNQEQELQHAIDMQETYQRMAKYSLDPENQQRYQARADGWQARAEEIRNEPPVIPPAIKPVVNVAPQATTPPAPSVASEEERIRQRIAEIKAQDVSEELAEAERQQRLLKDYYDTYGNVKAVADATKQDIANRLLELEQKYIKKNEERPSILFKDFAEKYRYIREHLPEFENGTYADGIKVQIKDLKKQNKKVQKELEAEYNALEGIIGEPNVSRLGAYKEKNTTAIKHFLDDAPAKCRELWNEFAGNFRVLSGGGSKAYYSPSVSGVKLSINSASKGSHYQTPYQVVFHEYGHSLDWELNRKYGNGKRMESFTENYKDGIFGKTVQREANEAIEKFAKECGYTSLPNRGTVVTNADSMVRRGLLKQEEKAEWIRTQMQTVQVDRITAEKEFCKYINEKYELLQRTDISDMFESIMRTTDYPFGVGHGKRYWGSIGNSYKNCGQEAFAEMYSAIIANAGSWEVIQEYFPEAVKIFNEILEVTKI